MREKVGRMEDQLPRKKVVVGGAFEVRLLIGCQLFYEGLALVQSAVGTGAWSEAELHIFLGIQGQS